MNSKRPEQAGFTLIELMVGMAVGLLVTLAIAAVLVNAENQRRTTTTGSDAQINGGLAIYTLERQLKMAGYGLITDTGTAGCALTVQSGGSAIAGAPPVLAPVIITQGAGGTAPDTIRVLASSKRNFVMSAPLKAPYYDPNQSSAAQDTTFFVKSNLGIAVGDLLALVYGLPDTTCEVFQATSLPAADTVKRDASAWNANKFPSKAASTTSYLVNLGTLTDLTYSITADQRLRQSSFSLATKTATTQDVQSNVVMLKALYGKDSNADGKVDSYDVSTPTTNAGWLQVRAVRIVVVSRSEQYEKEIVTATNPLWYLGSVDNIDNNTGAAACGSGNGKCITLHVDGASDWQHYRYKVFEVLVPLRNQLWSS